MWLFDKRIALKESGLFQGYTDWHCHLLPRVDDGIQAMDDTLKMLDLYKELGVKEVWFTPHIMEDTPNTTMKLQSKFVELKTAYQGNIRLHLAAEYMLDNLFEQRLKNDDLLPIGEDGDKLLVETSYYNPPMGFKNILLRIKSRGYIPVLAHPERYNYMSEIDYMEIYELGVKFQSNIPSLVNAYGGRSYTKLEWLLSKNMVNLWGTDTHNYEFFSTVLLEKKVKLSLVKKIQS